MKKTLSNIIAVVGLSSLFLTSCKLTPSQIILIAEETGLFSAVGWVAVDNPSMEAKQAVMGILDVINEKASMVETGTTYSVVIYPELVKVIDDKVDSRYRPMCKVASIVLLGQLDLLFASHPEWKEDQAIALGVVKSYVNGAIKGLSLASSDPISIQARENLQNKILVKNTNGHKSALK